MLHDWLLQPSRKKHQAADNQIEKVKKAARTYPTEVPSILWDWMFKTVVLLIWVSEENKKTLGENAGASHHYTLQDILKHK